MRKAVNYLSHIDNESRVIIGSVSLSYDERRKRRILLTDDSGEKFMLELSKPQYLKSGGFLELQDGQLIEVNETPEEVVEFRALDPVHAIKLAWFVGNRHTPLQILENGTMRIQYDHVLESMIQDQGGIVEHKKAPFSPLGGAYEHEH